MRLVRKTDYEGKKKQSYILVNSPKRSAINAKVRSIAITISCL